MSDHEKCAEVCEDHGFARQAGILRAVARGGLRVFAVCERLSDDYGSLTGEGCVPVALFLDRADAEHDARRREILAFCTRNLYKYCDKNIAYITDRSADQFEREVSAILGADYRLPAPATHSGPLFPADATDEQMQAVFGLFNENTHFFQVAELDIVDGANPTPSGESPS